MADIIPVEPKSVFSKSAERDIKIENAVQTATDLAGPDVVREVVDTTLRNLRNELSVEAGKKDIIKAAELAKRNNSTNVTPEKKGLFGWGILGL